MTEIRPAALPPVVPGLMLLSDREPIRLQRVHPSLMDGALRPLRRGLVFAAALSLPVLGSSFADRFHGNDPRAVQAAAVPWFPPHSGTAARFSLVGAAAPALRLAQAEAAR